MHIQVAEPRFPEERVGSTVQGSCVPDKCHLCQVAVVRTDAVEHAGDRQTCTHRDLCEHRKRLPNMVLAWSKDTPDCAVDAPTHAQAEILARAQTEPVLATLCLVCADGSRHRATIYRDRPSFRSSVFDQKDGGLCNPTD